ncbi:hypothetical protein MMC30_002926 [Trapelia coarctata]|nr:hypothetical protein [Trapelia coarctata]
MESQAYQPVNSSYIPSISHIPSYPTDWLIFATVFVPALLLLFGLSTVRAGKDILAQPHARKPSTYPSSIPCVSHALSMAWDPDRFLSTVTTRFKNVPVRLKLLVTDVYVLSGPEFVNALWKEPRTHTRIYKFLAIHNTLGMTKKQLALWYNDNSGIGLTPYPGTNVPPHLRVDHMTWSTISKFLTGPGLKPFLSRFTSNLTEQCSTMAVKSEWTEYPDLLLLVREEFFAAALKALCGSYFLAICPTFVQEFWQYHYHISPLGRGYPRWLYSKAYKCRDVCRESVKQWHKFIRSHLHDPLSGPGHWSPYYGADVMRFRQDMRSKIPEYDADAAAADDLGFIWASNGNSITASFWMIAEIIKDPTLLSKVRVIADNCRIPSPFGKLNFDFETLFNHPLLQSIYAETLRLRVASFILRVPDHQTVTLKGWIIPNDAPLMVSSYHAQMNKEIWSTTAHPATEFWAERFLVYPVRSPEKKLTTSAPKFSLEGRTDHWLPFGGGHRMCSGRYFAKQEMIAGTAIMLSTFDIELLNKGGKVPGCRAEGFGFGTLSPDGETPVRMRRRAW